jgi:uncharacterized membrane protein
MEEAVESAETGPDPGAERLFVARLTPYRSMTRRSFRLMIGLFTVVSFASSVPFVLLGAWPVAGFMGLDVAILYLAFRANFKAARAYEEIVVTPLDLLLAKVSARGRRSEWRSNPAWTRLDRHEHEEFGLIRLSLWSRGRSVEVAPFLGPAEKARLASGLSLALSEARRGPRFS